MEHKPGQDTLLTATLHLAEYQRTMAEALARLAATLDQLDGRPSHMAETERARTATDLRIAEILAASQEKIAASEARTEEALRKLAEILDRVIHH